MLQVTILYGLQGLRKNYVTLAKSLIYSKHGKPLEVLKMCENEIKCPSPKQVLVKMLAAPVNPVDVELIRGECCLLPRDGKVGSEGVGKVIALGCKVRKFCEGQRVVFLGRDIGTWRTYALFEVDKLYPISDKVNLPEAATFVVNPTTAYRILKDYVPLKKGETVIQNGANSAVGQYVHQLCKVRKLNSVGIIRNREDTNALKKYLKSIGATEVLTEDELCETKIFEKKLKKPKLGINSVGGDSATRMAHFLQNDGVLVTYSNLSNAPFHASSEKMICNNIKYAGFWIDRWLKDNYNTRVQKKMFKEIQNLMIKGRLKAPIHQCVDFEDYMCAKESLNNEEKFGKKTIFKIGC